MTYPRQDFAVLLNKNARHVSNDVLSRIHEIVDPEDIFVSTHEGEANRIVEGILDRDYETVFTGGGDGTVTHFINRLHKGTESQPRIGILRLGTGNAMAEIVSSGDPLIDLRTYVANPSRDSYELPLCEAEGVRFAFAGLGLDAAILNDYGAFKRRFGRGPFKPIVSHLSGYMAATFSMTAPRQIGRWLRKKSLRVRITNLGSSAYAIDPGPNGATVGRIYSPGEVLYEGPFRATALGTCPFYGYRLKALPYAGLDHEHFHLRVMDVPSAKLVINVRRFWNGSIRHPGIHDFHAQRVHLRFSEPVPYQLAGEAVGYRDELTVNLAGRPVDLVRFI